MRPACGQGVKWGEMMTDQSKQGAEATLYRPHAFHIDDWQILDSEAALPTNGSYFLGLERALDVLANGTLSFKLGVIVDAGEDVTLLGDYLDQIASIAVHFPAFSDGRAFSSARLLAERYAYRGEVRATGAYILDQMPMLVRCGVSAFDVQDPNVRAGLERGDWPDVTNYYQPTGNDEQLVNNPRPWLRRSVGL
ncbi:MAG: DUF934 domain-containing protein [Cohaesibacter sp.]|nr:DUF934 domain-containing protein [Cohaesibacter sp.]